MSSTFKGSRVLVTGGTGSFGNASINRFLNSEFEEVIVFSRDEKKQEDMRIQYRDERIRFVIGDVRDKNSVLRALAGVDYVFHAAALKQVPACEFYPDQAVQTNVLGAQNLIEACKEANVKKAILLSTDKAVYPVNAMGMTKALMEKLVTANARAASATKGVTSFCLTRYGNVMGSRGSVIPLFISQIKHGEALTVTDPSMTRFLMTLEESVDLVLYAFANGADGDLFVQKAPACSVETLALALLKVFNAKNEIKIIGTRHAEKLYETLVSREEMATAEDRGDYYRIPADIRTLNYHSYLEEGSILTSTAAEYNSHNTVQLSIDQVVQKLLALDMIKALAPNTH